MVDKKQKFVRSRAGHRGSVRSVVSPPPLPPRWGEGVAPPTSPVKYQTTDRIKQRKVRTNTKTDEMTIKSRTLPLSYPSPPLRSKPCKAPLTSTFMVSPGKMMMYSKVQERVHTTSPITPEMSGIARAVTNTTTYQNYEAGVAYVPADQLCPPDAQLSRFHVSPPHPRMNQANPVTGGTLLNNNRVTQPLRHPGSGWIYGSQSKLPKKLSLPKKLDWSLENGLEDELKIDKKETNTKGRRSVDIRKLRRQHKAAEDEARGITNSLQSESDYCDMRLVANTGQHQFSQAGEDMASLISFGSLASSGGSGDPVTCGPRDIDPGLQALFQSSLSDEQILATLVQWTCGDSHNSSSRYRHGCLPYLINLLHLHPFHTETARPTKHIRCQALHVISNLIQHQLSDKWRKRESKVMGLLWLIRQYTDFLRDLSRYSATTGGGGAVMRGAGCRPVTLWVDRKIINCDLTDVTESQLQIPQHNILDFGGKLMEINLVETVGLLTRCSFDERYRDPIISLGGVQALAELLLCECQFHYQLITEKKQTCEEVRRFILISLTNLTFGNNQVKSYLCTLPHFITRVVELLESHSENLQKASSHLLRNLAWKADKPSKLCLSKSGAVSRLVSTAMRMASQLLVVTPMGRTVEPGSKEQNLKVVLSALWNLSAHSRRNKVDICEEQGSIVFLVELLRSNSVTIVENGGGILRNISSYIAMADKGETYRCILREENCLPLLLEHLRSSSMTVVSNAAGTLWNLSARSGTDQAILINLGAVPLLQSLASSRHKSISTCAAATIKNLHHGPILTSPQDKLFGAALLSTRNARNLVESIKSKLSESVESDSDELSSKSDQSSDGESFTDSLSETVTKVNLARFNPNKLPAHTNGNYLHRKLDTCDKVNHIEFPLDLRIKRSDSLESVNRNDAVSHEILVTGGGNIEIKLDTPPEFGEEKASYELKGEKIVESPQQIISSFDSDSTKSFQEEGSPMSVQSSNKETSGDSDDDNDISESLLKEIINSAMPTSTNNDNMIPTPRSVWDSDNSNKTVICQEDQHQAESLRQQFQSNYSSLNVSYDTGSTDEYNDTSLQHCEELHEDENMPVLNDLQEEKVTIGDAEITFDDNITNINNNKVTLKKEATFVVDEEGKINDSFDINDARTKLKSHTSSTSPAGNGLVKIRKSKSEHQLADSNSDEIKKNYRRSWSKSPRSSRLIPGVVIKELKLKPKSECPTPVKSETLIEDESKKENVILKENFEEVKLMKEEPLVVCNENASENVVNNVHIRENIMCNEDFLGKSIRMTSSIISNYDDTISKIEEPSAMEEINNCSEAVTDLVQSATDERKIFLISDLSLRSISHQLDSIRPPTIMDEITITSKTLKADNNPAATYVIDEEDANTVDDVTDVFDEESTLTPRGDEDLCDIPDLPLDSVHTTPSRSSGMATPDTVRKMKKDDICEKNKEMEDDTTSQLTFIIDNQQSVNETSGYRSMTTDIVDVDERLNEIVGGSLYKWHIEEEMDMIELEAKMMLDTLTSSGLRSRSASVVSDTGTEEASRCSSIGILKDSHIAKLELESELISGRPQSKIHNRDSFANKEFRPKVAPKPSFIKLKSSERNSSYLIATKNPQFDLPLLQETKSDKINAKQQDEKAEKSLKVSNLWKRSAGEKPSLEVKSSKSKIPMSSKVSKPSSQMSVSHKSFISKTFENLGLKRVATKNPSKACSSATTPTKDKRLGTSIVLLSPNDAEVIEKFNFPPAVQTEVHYAASEATKRITTVTSVRDNLNPIIDNPRKKFLASEKQNLIAKTNFNRKLEFQDTIRSDKKISANNKVTLV